MYEGQYLYNPSNESIYNLNKHYINFYPTEFIKMQFRLKVKILIYNAFVK